MTEGRQTLDPIVITPASAGDIAVVASILTEAAGWLEASGMAMWKGDELTPSRIADDVKGGQFFLAMHGAEAIGTIRFQLSDEMFWPDMPDGDAAYVHRLAVRRAYAGRGVSTALLAWSVERTRALDRRYLRLDTVASRSKLRALYEGFGFRHHSDRQVGPYLVARYELDVTAR